MHRDMRAGFLSGVILPVAMGVIFSLLAGGCPKRTGGDIDVDSVQGRVDAIDHHLSQMKKALVAKDIDRARDEWEEANDILNENADELAAYPEVGDLKERLRRASVNLCASEVELRLSHYFSAIRAGDPEEARSKFGEVEKAWNRCSQRVGQEGEMAALKASVEAAPAEIVRLEKTLAEEKSAAEVSAAEGSLAKSIENLEVELAGLEKAPPPAEKVEHLAAALGQLQASLAQAAQRLGANARWPEAASRLQTRLQALSARFAALERRRQIHTLTTGDLLQAEQLAQSAILQRDLQKAREAVGQANQIYQSCLERTKRWMAEEPALKRWTFKWKNLQRTVEWLKTHCQANADITARMLQKLGQKPAAAPAAPEPEPEKKQPPSPKPKRKGRIKRW